MKSCILTIIKDEHLYLEEWIKYHLNIGVSYIFIFEDIGSKSHSNIVDSYKNNVSLIPALTLLSDGEREIVLNNKIKKKTGGQQSYLKAGLSHIKKYFDYDWCFVINNDEFITLKENKTLDEILNLYADYDAFIMAWKCYGANGLVKRPDYTTKGVVDTFTEPAKGHVPGKLNLFYTKKTCYNLKTYQPEFWGSDHVPSDKSNFCNTVCEREKMKDIYTNIYIRHYITKSWEEYVWKKKTRGYFYGFSRTFDAFFTINPDMMPMKDTLLAQIEDETLVVMPYYGPGAQGNEIRLMLTAWKKFCQFKYHFVVIGEFDPALAAEFDWVEFIYESCLEKRKDQYNPHLDIQHKMETAYKRFRNKYNGFLYVCDDFYAIKPFTLEDVTAIYYHELTFTGIKDLPTWFWKHDKWKTRQLLDKEHLPHINYTAHCPCYFNFKRLMELWNKYNMREESYVPEDVYFNSFKHEDPLPDKIRIGICKNYSSDTLAEKLQNAQSDTNVKFIFNSVEGWSKELEEALWKIVV